MIVGVRMSYRNQGKHWIDDKRRNQIYKRDNFKCQYCGSSKKIGLDHVDNKRNNSNSNLLTCCHSCNSSKKARPWDLWAAQKGYKITTIAKKLEAINV